MCVLCVPLCMLTRDEVLRMAFGCCYVSAFEERERISYYCVRKSWDIVYDINSYIYILSSDIRVFMSTFRILSVCVSFVEIGNFSINIIFHYCLSLYVFYFCFFIYICIYSFIWLHICFLVSSLASTVYIVSPFRVVTHQISFAIKTQIWKNTKTKQ